MKKTISGGFASSLKLLQYLAWEIL